MPASTLVAVAEGVPLPSLSPHPPLCIHSLCHVFLYFLLIVLLFYLFFIMFTKKQKIKIK